MNIPYKNAFPLQEMSDESLTSIVRAGEKELSEGWDEPDLSKRWVTCPVLSGVVCCGIGFTVVNTLQLQYSDQDWKCVDMTLSAGTCIASCGQ